MNQHSIVSTSENSEVKGHESYAMVTGASSGIGRAIAEELAKKGIGLILVALPQTGLELVARQLSKKYGVEVLTFGVDLTLPDAPFKLFSACQAKNLNIEILVNNAGFGNLELFENSDLKELNQMMILNNQAVVGLTHLFIPILKKNKPSYILNLGSLASFFKIPYKAVYSATKSFVFSFSAALRQELKPVNISVSCLCPGSTLTSERVQDIIQRTSGKSPLFIQSPQIVAQWAIKKLFEGQFKIVPGFHNRILLAVYSMLPEIFTEKILLKLFKPRQNGQVVISVRKQYSRWVMFSLANR